MPITTLKIHPAIGIARVGNSPDEFFIGPERPLEKPIPAQGFKDAQCRVKRQAARFRVFAYDENGQLVQEITAADADISWTAHLVNKKSASYAPSGGSAADLSIDPGTRTTNGPAQRQIFDTGKFSPSGNAPVTVPLGEMRTDHDNRLLVMGGSGATDRVGGTYYYDDVSDGPINASVKLHSNGQTLQATGAWVIVGPPKFAPQLDSPITLYDKIYELAYTKGWVGEPATPSYTNDIYPILERARHIKWVVQLNMPAHTWPDPVYDQATRTAIFSHLRPPAGESPPVGGAADMPAQSGSPSFTQVQYDNMSKWSAGNFLQDWVGTPAPSANITPQGLDQAALENCVGGAFFPGIEAGGSAATTILDPAKYIGAADPMRLNQAAVNAGDMTAHMALPWQGDFSACGPTWWPVPRPDMVFLPGASGPQVSWTRDITDMYTQWPTLGFVLSEGNAFTEQEKCGSAFIELLTQLLQFQDVPQGPMGMSRKLGLPIVFEISSTAPVTLAILPAGAPASPRLSPNPPASVTVGPTPGNSLAYARLWIVYETGPVGEILSDQVTVTNTGSGQTWTIPISANTVARKTAAAALVLDHSGSMSEDRGDGQSKYQSLMDASCILVDVMVQGDALGIVRFSDDADKLLDVLPLGVYGDPYDSSRINAKNIIRGGQLAPGGNTSIGDGIFEGRQILDAAGSGYDIKAMLVLTDGVENQPRSIADVAPQIDSQTFSIGLGKPENISVPALQTISGNNGGYCLITGPVSGDNYFILQKYFLQILAGINNTEVVLDPDGQLIPGKPQEIPFRLTDADAGVDIILLSPYIRAIDFSLVTPGGYTIEPWQSDPGNGILYALSDNVSYYRLVLPTQLQPGRFDQGGSWKALLSIGKPRQTPPSRASSFYSGYLSSAQRPATQRERAAAVQPDILQQEYASQARGRKTLPYSLVVHSYSSLSFRASLIQSGFEPGATATLHASVAFAGIPSTRDIYCWAEVKKPNQASIVIELKADENGQFGAHFSTSLQGVYTFRIRARGRSQAGYPFLREQTLTAAVWHGGDRDANPSSPGGPLVQWLCERDERLCQLLRCILAEGGLITPDLEKRLRETGLNLGQLRECLKKYCTTGGSGKTSESCKI